MRAAHVRSSVQIRLGLASMCVLVYIWRFLCAHALLCVYESTYVCACAFVSLRVRFLITHV